MKCISFLGQLKEMMQGQSCGMVTNLNAHRFLYGHIIVMAHNCSWKMSSLRWLMSYLTHWDHCPLSYQQQIGYFEIQRKALQLVLSQHWVKPLGFTISVSWSWILKQWREFNEGIPRRWMGDTRCWKKASRENLTCHCELQMLLSYFQE